MTERHGTAYRYNLGCRCDECRVAKMAKRRRTRDAARTKNSPAYQHELAVSRRLKEVYRGTCDRCGNPTTGCYGKGRAPTLCYRCSPAVANAHLIGTGPTQKKLLALLESERRFMEICDHFGWKPGPTSARLHRMLAQGLITRPRRGYYKAVP